MRQKGIDNFMKIQQGLRSYIAPSAPATRRPCDGTESSLRVEFGFTPRWFRQHTSVDFSERWHVDPLYRAETVTRMRKTLRQRFPTIPIGGAFEESAPGSLDGGYGALLVAAVFGIPMTYYADNWPAAAHDYLSKDQIKRMRAPRLEDAPVFVSLLEQMDALEEEYGRIEGYLNWQGVLNNAYRIRGPEILTDLLTEPELARHLFDIITETMINGMRLVYTRQEATGVQVRHATVSNCLVNMVSPQQYHDFLLPCDQRIADVYPRFGVHNCAWNVDPYIADYASITPLDYVDMGLDSDLAAARKLCPDTRRALMYTPMALTSKSPEALRADLTRVYQELGPCDVVMPDIEAGTPDERVLLFWEIAQEIAAQ